MLYRILFVFVGNFIYVIYMLFVNQSCFVFKVNYCFIFSFYNKSAACFYHQGDAKRFIFKYFYYVK